METDLAKKIDSFVSNEKQNWKLASDNYFALAEIKNKVFEIENNKIIVQFNPERIISSSAAVDRKSVSRRKCFLCKQNRPAEQKEVKIYPEYNLLLNPFPIFDPHFTIPANIHKPQLIKDEIKNFVFLISLLGDKYSLFYNGPECGASAPDHMHFQACPKNILPVEKEYLKLKIIDNLVYKNKEAEVFSIDDGLRKYFCLEFSDVNSFIYLDKIYTALEKADSFEFEPKINILGFTNKNRFVLLIFPRLKHRPDFYYEEDENKILISPATVDMGGIVICPREADFNRVNEIIIQEIFSQVCYSNNKFNEVLDFLNLN